MAKPLWFDDTTRSIRESSIDIDELEDRVEALEEGGGGSGGPCPGGLLFLYQVCKGVL